MHLRKEQMLVDGKEETAIAVYWVTGGDDCCRVGFLKRSMVMHASHYDGVLAQVTRVLGGGAPFCTAERRLYHTNRGCSMVMATVDNKGSAKNGLVIVLRWIRKQSSSGSYINNHIIMKKRRRRQRRRRQHYGGDGNDDDDDDDHEMTTSIRASIATLVLIGDFYGPAPVIISKAESRVHVRKMPCGSSSSFPPFSNSFVTVRPTQPCPRRKMGITMTTTCNCSTNMFYRTIT